MGISLQFLVKRKGLDFTGCGMADARAAKHQRVQQPGEGTPSQSPLSVVMVDEWESFQKSFRCAVHAHKDNGELDMGAHLLCSYLKLICMGGARPQGRQRARPVCVLGGPEPMYLVACDLIHQRSRPFSVRHCSSKQHDVEKIPLSSELVVLRLCR